MWLNIGTPKIINFSFETNGKLMVLGVPILKHFRVCMDTPPCPSAGHILGNNFCGHVCFRGWQNKVSSQEKNLLQSLQFLEIYVRSDREQNGEIAFRYLWSVCIEDVVACSLFLLVPLGAMFCDGGTCVLFISPNDVAPAPQRNVSMAARWHFLINFIYIWATPCDFHHYGICVKYWLWNKIAVWSEPSLVTSAILGSGSSQKLRQQ